MAEKSRADGGSWVDSLDVIDELAALGFSVQVVKRFASCGLGHCHNPDCCGTNPCSVRDCGLSVIRNRLRRPAWMSRRNSKRLIHLLLTERKAGR